MGAKTGIEWTDATWSPLRVRVRKDAAVIARTNGYTSLVTIARRMAGHAGPHCEHVSPGCEHCYAETNNRRCLPANGTGLPYDRRSRDLVEAFVDEKQLLLPLKWRSATTPLLIFVENQSDLFGDWNADAMIDRVFAVMALCPQHVFQVLTKRPERMRRYCSDDALLDRLTRAADGVAKLAGGRARINVRDCEDGFTGIKLPNVWLGVSVENQATADERIPVLLTTPAAVRFLSCEPLLGPLDLTRIHYRDEDIECEWNALTAFHQVLRSNSMDAVATADDGVTKIDWVIVGGESGPGARPMHPELARGLRDQCVAAQVPFFFKQWGEWWPKPDTGASDRGEPGRDLFLGVNGNQIHPQTVACLNDSQYTWMRRHGKKAAGAVLDGREWREVPVARQ